MNFMEKNPGVLMELMPQTPPKRSVEELARLQAITDTQQKRRKKVENYTVSHLMKNKSNFHFSQPNIRIINQQKSSMCTQSKKSSIQGSIQSISLAPI